MKYIVALLISLSFLTGCKSTGELKPVSQIKPGAAEEGSLANAKLISDAKAGLEQLVGWSIKDSELLKFVIQQPVGEVGSRSWREMWVIKKSNAAAQFIITFKEAGLGAADFEIKKMGENIAKRDCPNSVSGFKKGQTNLFIKGCLGEPNNINENPDGRYIYFYYRPKGIVLTYLFGPENKLTKFAAYQDKK